MSKQEPSPALEIPVEGMDAVHDYGVSAPNPSAPAAASAGAVGPGALAAAEGLPGVARSVRPKPATETDETEARLTPDEVETIRGLARRLGGVVALIHWLQKNPNLP